MRALSILIPLLAVNLAVAEEAMPLSDIVAKIPADVPTQVVPERAQKGRNMARVAHEKNFKGRGLQFSLGTPEDRSVSGMTLMIANTMPGPLSMRFRYFEKEGADAHFIEGVVTVPSPGFSLLELPEGTAYAEAYDIHVP